MSETENSLELTNLDLAFNLARTSFTLYKTVLCGSQTRDQKTIYDFMKEPSVGQLVFETTAGVLSL